MVTRSLNKTDMTGAEIMRMASIGCSQAEIAQKYGVSIVYLTDHFKQEYLQGIAELHENLRQAQLDCAYNNKGNATMLIFLGKCYLHQQEISHDEKMADIDILIEMLNKQSKCSNSPQNNSTASQDQTPGSISG